jgi:cytochrome b561
LHPLTSTRREATWVLFGFGALINALLAYANLSPQTNLGIALVTLIILGWGAFRCHYPESPDTGFSEDAFWPPLHFSYVGIALAVGILLRVLWLVSFHGWPLEDESMGAYLSMDLTKIWHLNVFPFFAQIPAFFTGFSAAFFNVQHPPYMFCGYFQH